ncbi:SDR family NAD(P)-dependent oxidoreductase [Caballeronia sp. LZ019]|uniref:SDR family NAD(P)-dependent oxidoreductase n=1 Tax=Caballeronia sp. LZ019 TaxID=3038555 RepID=UPI00285DC55E|nr:SDR family NAD(P)-dependent oxidoreductase [Caballeronia sp. LZ019]MDR5809237.1 SDR family NAD(P)-dependent oxidoreductase [Caballeronia sp. LZ019]
MEKPLDGQTVLVTGATGGLGASIVTQLAADGARPIIHYNRDIAKAEALLKRIDGRGSVLRCELSSPGSALELWSRAIQAEGRIHGLVNNAGIRTEITIDASPEEWRLAWLKEFQVNLFAAADLCREAIKHFKENGGGRIVNMASRAAQRGYAANAMPYGASKAALANLTKSIARSYGAEGVTAVNIAPGWVLTDMAEDYVATHGISAAVADIPIGKMAAPSEVAELVSFVLRPSQKSLNGATLDVNGGSYIR